MRKTLFLFCALFALDMLAQEHPCQPFTVEIESSDWINVIGELNACYDIDLNALTNYPNNDVYYSQADHTTTFQWTFGDGQSATSQSVDDYLYAEEGEYELSLLVTDHNGCTAEAFLTVVYDNPGIGVSIDWPERQEVCLGDTLQVGSGFLGVDSITNFFDPISWIIYEDIGEDFGEPKYLPDGEDVSYTTTVNVTTFDPLTVLNDDDFVEVCVEIEHSYLGDLHMSLTAPNDTEVDLFFEGLRFEDYTSVWLGNAIDGDITQTAGDCWEYCWSIDPEFGTFENEFANNNTVIAPLGGSSMIPGSYEPLGDFSDFEGSPANGLWTLTITDHLEFDNGFICAWSLLMDIEEEIITDTLVAEILSYEWYCAEEPLSIDNYDSTRVVVQPTISGMHTYVMTITDSYGCEYTEEFELEVFDAPITTSNGSTLCTYDLALVATDVVGGGLWELIDKPEDTTVYFSPNENSLTPEVFVSDFGAYLIKFTDLECETSDTLEVKFEQAIPQISYEELMRCDLQTQLAVPALGMEGGWEWIDGPVMPFITAPSSLETDLVVSQYGDYTFEYTACDTTVEFNILFMCDLLIPNVISPNGDDVNDLFTVKDLTYEFYSYSNMSIYNKWGDEVYKNGHYGLNGKWWDGQSTHQNDKLAEGVYFYVLKVGNKVTEEEDIYRGTVQLFRTNY